MKVYKGIVRGNSITTNRDGDRNVRMIKVEITEPEDIQQIEQILLSGEDNCPADNSEVVIIEVSESYKICIAVDDLIEPVLTDSGERKIYAHDGGVIKSYIHFKKDGSMQINGTGDFAVRFNKLKETIDELQNDITTLKTVFSTWVTVPNDGGAALKTAAATWYATALAKPIDPAKITEIELPS